MFPTDLQQTPDTLLMMFYLFSVVDNMNLTINNLNSDLSKINAWVNQCNMNFNPDPKKQAQEVLF